jgi:hypothetical protein
MGVDGKVTKLVSFLSPQWNIYYFLLLISDSINKHFCQHFNVGIKMDRFIQYH